MDQIFDKWMGIEFVKPNYPTALYPMPLRAHTDITDLAVHHTAGAITQTAIDIDAEHRALLPHPYAMIAYNWVIRPNGLIEKGREMAYVGGATYGRNRECVAVVLIGNFQSDDKGYTGDPTAAQLSSLINLGIALHLAYPISRTYGHGQVAEIFYGGDSNYSTDCCGSKLYAHLEAVKAAIRARMVQH